VEKKFLGVKKGNDVKKGGDSVLTRLSIDERRRNTTTEGGKSIFLDDRKKRAKTSEQSHQRGFCCQSLGGKKGRLRNTLATEGLGTLKSARSWQKKGN